MADLLAELTCSVALVGLGLAGGLLGWLVALVILGIYHRRLLEDRGWRPERKFVSDQISDRELRRAQFEAFQSLRDKLSSKAEGGSS